jgi:Tfp pilus assembly protein PilF
MIKLIACQRAAAIVALSLMLLAGSQSLPLVSTPSALAQKQEPGTSVDHERGIEFFNQGRFHDAIESLHRAVKNNKDDYDAWYYLGLAQVKVKNLKDATKSLETAVRLKPKYAPAHNALAYALLLRNKLPDTVSEAHATLDINPKMAEPHYFIGVARLRMDNRKEALAEAETAIKLDPQYPAGYLLKSQALVSFMGDVLISDPKLREEKAQDQYREAAAALEQYLQLDPNSENKNIWTEQLESLKVYSSFHQPNFEAGRSTRGGTKAVVLNKPAAGYTEDARRNQVTGTVVLKAIFAADGTVTHILVVKGLPDGLTNASIKAARGIKFSPAMIDGKPVSEFIQLEYNFSLY